MRVDRDLALAIAGAIALAVVGAAFVVASCAVSRM